MKKWSTDWTPINVVSHVQHKSVTQNVSPLALGAVNNSVIQAEEETEEAFTTFMKPPPEPEIIIQGHTDETLEDAKREAYEKGYKTAKEASNAQLQALNEQLNNSINTVFSSFTERLSPLVTQWHDYNEKIHKDSHQLAYTIARKVATNALDENADSNIKQLIDQCIGHILREPKVAITLHRSHLDDFKSHLKHHPALAPVAKQVEVIASDDMAPTDCQIEWHQGGATLNVAERWNHIESLLNLPITEPQTQAEQGQPSTDTPPDEKLDVQAETEGV